MNEPKLGEDPFEGASPEEVYAAVFANLVVQTSNTALIYLGKAPHPATKQLITDIEAAQHFILQLEMLAVKTKGNLDAREENLLNQSLTALRMAFVEAVDGGPQIVTPPSLTTASGQPIASSSGSAAGNVAAAPAASAPPAAAASTSTPPSAPPATASPAPTPAQPPASAPSDDRKKFTKKY